MTHRKNYGLKVGVLSASLVEPSVTAGLAVPVLNVTVLEAGSSLSLYVSDGRMLRLSKNLITYGTDLGSIAGCSIAGGVAKRLTYGGVTIPAESCLSTGSGVPKKVVLLGEGLATLKALAGLTTSYGVVVMTVRIGSLIYRIITALSLAVSDVATTGSTGRILFLVNYHIMEAVFLGRKHILLMIVTVRASSLSVTVSLTGRSYVCFGVSYVIVTIGIDLGSLGLVSTADVTAEYCNTGSGTSSINNVLVEPNLTPLVLTGLGINRLLIGKGDGICTSVVTPRIDLNGLACCYVNGVNEILLILVIVNKRAYIVTSGIGDAENNLCIGIVSVRIVKVVLTLNYDIEGKLGNYVLIIILATLGSNGDVKSEGTCTAEGNNLNGVCTSGKSYLASTDLHTVLIKYDCKKIVGGEGVGTVNGSYEGKVYAVLSLVLADNNRVVTKNKVRVGGIYGLVIAALGLAVPSCGKGGVTLCGNGDNNLITSVKSENNRSAKLKSSSLATIDGVGDSYGTHNCIACSKGKICCGRSSVLERGISCFDRIVANYKGIGDNGLFVATGNFTCNEGPGDSPISLGSCAYVVYEGLACCKIYLNGVGLGNISVMHVVNLRIAPCIVCILAVKAEACRKGEGVSTGLGSGEGVLVKPTVVIGSGNVDLVSGLFLYGSNLGLNLEDDVTAILDSVGVVGTDVVCTGLGNGELAEVIVVLTSANTLGALGEYVISLRCNYKLAVLIKDTDLTAVAATVPPYLNGSGAVNNDLDSVLGYITGNVTFFILNVIVDGGCATPVKSETLCNGVTVGPGLILSGVNLGLCGVVDGVEAGILLNSAICLIALCKSGKSLNVKNVGSYAIVVGILCATCGAGTLYVVVSGSVDSSLSLGGLATNGTNLTVGKTGLSTSGSFTRYLLLGVTESCNCLSVGVATLVTSEGLLALFGTSGSLSLFNRVRMLGALGYRRYVFGIYCATNATMTVCVVAVCCYVGGCGSALLSISTGCCVPVIGLVIGPFLTERVLVNRGLGLKLVDKALNCCAGCKSEYCRNKNNHCYKQLKVSLHNRDPPFEFLFQFMK